MQEVNGGMRKAVESILTDLVESAGSERANALFAAAVPQWFSTDLYTALVPNDAPNLLDWVSRFSFVSTLTRQRTDFMMQPMERAIMNDLFIDRDPITYREVHGRALDYWVEHPYHDPVVQAQNLLYHRIIVDQETARQELVNIFEQYVNERQLGAMEKLLKAASEACGYLTKLGQPTRGLPELILYMRARQAQLQGNWQESEEMLAGIDVQAEPDLQPFVTRAQGFARAGQRDFAGAIEQFQLAADQFAQLVDILGEEWSLVERADTLIALGDAYLDLAEATISLAERRKRHESKRRFLQGIYYLLLSLPLAAYMTRAIGVRAWLPHLWAMWRDVDWIKGDLYSQATRRYREAGRLLERVDRPDRNLVADEKLADLYLSVGDAVEAHTLYERLLASKELSDYRRSRIEVSLGQTQWLLGDEENAERVLAGAIPALRYYADETLEAKAETVLGSIAANSDDPAAALSHFSRALDIYLVEENADLVSATDVAEQLDLVAKNPSLSPEARAASREQAARVIERRYPVQQRFALTRFFQQLFLFSVIVLGGIGLLNVITIDRTTVVPDIVFHASPLLDAARGEPALMVGTTTYAISDTSEIILGEDIPAELQVAQGIRSLVVENPELSFALAGIIIAFSSYLIAVTFMGILLLWRIDPQEVQDTSQSSMVIFSDEKIAVGEEGAQKSVSFDNVSRYITSNTRLFRQPTSDSYLLLERASGEQVIVSGATAHYENLQQHIEKRLPAATERSDLGHSLLISLTGVLLLLTVVLYLLIVIFSRAGEESVNSPIAGSPYTGVTLLPYLLLGFLLPVLWWFVWKPLQRRHKLDKFDWSPFLLILIGLLIVLTIIIVTGLGYHVRLSTPDLYPVLAAIGLMLAGTAALTLTALGKRRRGAEQISTEPSEVIGREVDEQDAQASQSGVSLVKRIETRAQTISVPWRIILFILLYILLLLVSTLAILYISTEVRAYHYWVQGEEILKEADRLKKGQIPGWEESIEEARQNYSESIRIAEGARWKFFPDEILADIYTNRAHASLILGIEELTRASGLADADTADLTFYESALADYEKAIELDPNSAQGYLWLGFAHHTAGDIDAARENYSRAILFGGLTEEELQTWDSGATCPRHGEEGIYLEPEQLAKAFTGLGWIYFSEEDYQDAQANFLLASAYADCLEPDIVQERSEAALGLGYTYYKDRRFDEAESVWLQAEERDSQNAALLISLGTIYWRLGTLGEDYSQSGKDRCSQDSLSEEEKRDAASLLEKSIDYLRRSAEIEGQLAADVAYTYRTIGQVQYLLRNCPGYDSYLVFKDAVDSYSKAIELNKEEPMYPYMRARLRYVQWKASTISGPDGREPVVKALVDITDALRLFGHTCPESGYEPCGWYSTIRKEAVDGVFARGDERFARGEYGTAIGYYMLLIDNVPYIDEITSAQFRLSLAELARGNPAEAQRWYETATARPTDVDYLSVSRKLLEATLALAERMMNEGEFSNARDAYRRAAAEFPDLTQDSQFDFDFGLAELAVGNETRAATLFRSGMAQAAEADNKAAIIQAWWDLHTFAEQDPEIDIAIVSEVFAGVEFELDPAAAINEGFLALRAGEEGDAVNAFERGLASFIALGDLDQIKQHLIAVLNEPAGETRTAVLDVFSSKLHEMEAAAAGDLAVEEAFDLAFMAWALGEPDLAARWYQEGIRRTAEYSNNTSADDAAIYRAGLRASRDDLYAYWQSGAPVDADALIAAMDDYRPTQLEAFPDLKENGLYWRYQGWFKYHVALKAFLAGDSDVAGAVLESGRRDAEYAFPLDENGNRFVFEYLNQGAWSWYFIERAMELEKAGDLEAAYADFVTALASYPDEVSDNTARTELVDAAFDAGFLAFKHDLSEQAVHWYTLGVRRAEEYGLDDKIDGARDSLQSLEAANETEAALQEDILNLLAAE